jgi:DNA polymerase IV
MADLMPSTPTLPASSPPAGGIEHTLDLSELPPIFVSATHFETDNLHQLEEQLVDSGAALTYDLTEARIVLSKVTRKPRILFDLKAKGLWTAEVKQIRDSSTEEEDISTESQPLPKKLKVDDSQKNKASVSETIAIDDSSTESEAENNVEHALTAGKRKLTRRAASPKLRVASLAEEALIKVVKVDWFHKSLDVGRALPLDNFVTYQGRQVEKPDLISAISSTHTTSRKSNNVSTRSSQPASSPSASIVERAKEDAPAQPPRTDRFGKRKFGHTVASTASASWEAGFNTKQLHAHLLHTTTSENDSGVSSDLPEMPEWVKAGVKYACQRLTPKDQPNEAFIALLKKIKVARLLTNDEIGVRAYSTSIAALAAYPYKVSNPREIMALPGCDAKIANLYIEWVNTGRIEAVDDIEADDDLRVLRLFYDIWGVGATTAREFYFDKGWRELDDIVDYGWKTLTRVQQIGVKFYNEFLDQIPRAEVEEIGRIVHRHACKVRNDGIQSMIVGGYRRGKEASGDVDMIVSHPDEEQTLNIINDIVTSLEDEGWITHTLLLSLNSTNRGQQTLPFRAGGGGGGHGFDTLDKALVVWQDPNWPTKEVDLAADPKAKNPNIHRRVDIIISPWRTVGCAVLGWSAGTTFERDLRRYAKNVKGWKFDSSGVRSRGNGEVVDVEGFYDYKGSFGEDRATTMKQAERRVFEGMELIYREPWERCTG